MEKIQLNLWKARKKIKAQQVYEYKQERFDSDSVDNRNMSI